MGFLGDAVGSVINPLSESLTQTNGSVVNVPQDVWQRQQELAKALELQAQGIGPNPAQDQYANNLNQVAGQQAGAISSTKGISPALAARMIGNQAGQAKVQGAGQAAMMQAQQQIAAQQQQAQLANQMVQQSLAGQGANAQIGQANAQARNTTSMGIMQGIASAAGGGASAGSGGGAPPKAAHGGMIDARNGMIVPGEAKFPGDNEKNDTVHILASPEEIIIPRSLVNDPEKAKKFIEQLKKKKDKASYGKVLQSRRKK
jgi:hypothetical protein